MHSPVASLDCTVSVIAGNLYILSIPFILSSLCRTKICKTVELVVFEYHESIDGFNDRTMIVCGAGAWGCGLTGVDMRQ